MRPLVRRPVLALVPDTSTNTRQCERLLCAFMLVAPTERLARARVSIVWRTSASLLTGSCVRPGMCTPSPSAFWRMSRLAGASLASSGDTSRSRTRSL